MTNLTRNESALLSLFRDLSAEDRQSVLRYAVLVTSDCPDPETLARVRALPSETYRMERNDINEALSQLEELTNRLSAVVSRMEAAR